MDALRLPTAPGLNATWSVHDPPTLIVPLQLSVSLKSPAFVPLIPIFVISTGPVPVFTTVIGTAGLLDPESRFPNQRS